MASQVTQSRYLAACCFRRRATTTRLTGLLWLVAIVAAAGVPAVGQAQIIEGVRIHDVSSEIVGGFHDLDRRALYTVDGSGFIPDANDPLQGYHDRDAELEGGPGTYWSTVGNIGGDFGVPNDPLPAYIVFDLNEVYDLDSFTVWNGNEFSLGGLDLTNRGASAVDVSVGVDPQALTLVGNYSFEEGPGSEDVLYGETFDLSGIAAADAVRYVRFDILTNHGDEFEIVSIAEVRFSGTGTPPEMGDANRDGMVDEADLAILQSNLYPAYSAAPLPSTFASWDDGDFNGDAVVTLADYRIWKGVVDAAPGQLVGGANVPEPSTGVLLLLATSVAVRLCQRRRKS